MSTPKYKTVNGRSVRTDHESANTPKPVVNQTVANALKERQERNKRLRVSGKETASIAPANVENTSKD